MFLRGGVRRPGDVNPAGVLVVVYREIWWIDRLIFFFFMTQVCLTDSLFQTILKSTKY